MSQFARALFTPTKEAKLQTLKQIVSLEQPLLASVWTPAPPTGTTNYLYQWSQMGDMVVLRYSLEGTVAAALLTGLEFPLPADCPPPRALGTEPNGAILAISSSARFHSTLTGVGGSLPAVYLRKDTALPSGYKVQLTASATAALAVRGEITYRTTV